MHVRVVRFTDVTAERVRQLVADIEEAGEAPPGIPTTGVQLLFDEAQGTAVVLQLFETADDMTKGAEAFSAMDPAETPGTRVSVDMCEHRLDLHATGCSPEARHGGDRDLSRRVRDPRCRSEFVFHFVDQVQV